MTALAWVGGLLAIPLAALLMITHPRIAAVLVLAVFALIGCRGIECSGTANVVAFMLYGLAIATMIFASQPTPVSGKDRRTQ